MPHLTVEYTSNLGGQARIDELLLKANRVLCAIEQDQKPVYPIGAIRSRAIELKHYCIADGSEDDAFVHVTLKIGAGRSSAVKRDTASRLFEMLKEHFAAAFGERYLALSLDVAEFSEEGTLKLNNIHKRYTKA
ncbi:MAG: 5-carboxymethyl-2-hydroxymuconate Delta-isomerase [Burkholderiaceae bacterium]